MRVKKLREIHRIKSNLSIVGYWKDFVIIEFKN